MPPRKAAKAAAAPAPDLPPPPPSAEQQPAPAAMPPVTLHLPRPREPPAVPRVVSPPELPPGFVSPVISLASFKAEAAQKAAALRSAADASAHGVSYDEDVAALALDDVAMATMQQAVRSLFESAARGDGAPGGDAATDVGKELEALFASPPPEASAPPLALPAPGGGVGGDVAAALAAPAAPAPTAPDAAAARELRAAHHAALRAAPLQALRDCSVELALRRAERTHAGAPGAKRQRAAAPAPPRPAAPPAPAAPLPLPAPTGGDLIGDDELILRFALYNPTAKRDSVCVLEVLALGSQTLAQLRDALTCPSDATAARFRVRTPGAFFYFEGVFYNDLRAPGATDLSAPLRDFVEDGTPLVIAGDGATETHEESGARRGGVSGPGLALQRAVLGAADAASTRLDALALRIGKTYVYTHQGSCEHSLRLRDVRRACAADARSRAAYPACVYRTERVRRRCAICDGFCATKVVYDSRLAPESPCFLCGECFQRLHYDAQGRILFSDFEVFDYDG